MRSCDKGKERVCAKEEENVSVVKRREKSGVQVH